MSTPDVDQDVIEMARGLFDSRVVVKRPPSAAQRRAYHAPPKGPPIAVPKQQRPCSAKARINSSNNDVKKPNLPPRPPWRPFTRASSLSKIDGYLHSNTPDENIKDNDKHDSKEPSIYDHRTLPQGLVPLSEWLTEQVPSDWAKGYSSESSFVFLPCLHYIKNDLPCVPLPQQPQDQLPYTVSQQTQKYKAPRSRSEKHADLKQKSAPEQPSDNSDDQSSQVNHMRMYNSEGELVHDVYRGKRGAELIKQEIRDLELLLQGIGNPEGSSIVVRYQHDINHLQNMVKSTLQDYNAQHERPCTPVAVALQEDLVKYPAQHDEIMEQIRKRRDECVEELAAIEKLILHGKT
ncbi:uncharacterized protein LOC110239924 [Exaiptasia diaphana]|uniref:Uncharacterized protein n=1 Tax=Exaiptasia diaphana TaxID=2652724 RepID=A0A913XA66_EXADI|nr:uncharacterized protein LOC110239924 [Exaiptasia diaphana]KXJ26553.1 hypothetical protein AC249_AIPGENE8277 [Exaiptasia diaphana]